ncbi:MAG: MFS transporter [Dehalococcoidales bacterium]|nr:MFS transporter [Dehalococcoidales bacterium]
MIPYLVFIVASCVMLFNGISASAISVAFPDITASFNTSLVVSGWILSSFQVVSTVSMVIMGKVSDVIGRKATFLICLSLIIAGSLCAALSPNIQLLIFSRVLQGLGGGGFIPSVVAITAEQFPNSRQKAIGLSMSIFPIGQIIGPNLGSWLLSSFGWRSIFWINVPLGLVAIIFMSLLLHRQETKKAYIDFTGAGLFTGALFALMFGISEIGMKHNTILSWATVGLLFAVFIILIGLFLRHEIKSKEPIIDMEVLKKKPFVSANIYNFIFGVCMFGLSAFIPLYAVSVYHMSTFESGIVLAARSVGMILTSFISSFFLVRWGYRWPMLIGTFLLAIAFALLGLQPSHFNLLGITFGELLVISLIVGLSGIGMGIASPAANNACIDLMPTKVGTITGVRGMFRQAGGAISIAIITLILESSGSIARGFDLTFIGMSILTLITVPFIFGMPERVLTLHSKTL